MSNEINIVFVKGIETLEMHADTITNRNLVLITCLIMPFILLINATTNCCITIVKLQC